MSSSPIIDTSQHQPSPVCPGAPVKPARRHPQPTRRQLDFDNLENLDNPDDGWDN